MKINEMIFPIIPTKSGDCCFCALLEDWKLLGNMSKTLREKDAAPGYRNSCGCRDEMDKKA